MPPEEWGLFVFFHALLMCVNGNNKTAHKSFKSQEKQSSLFVLASIESCSHNQKKTKALDPDWSYSDPPGKDGKVSRPHTSLGMMMVAHQL